MSDRELITNLNEIPPVKNYGKHNSSKTVLPDKYLKKIKDLINEMEIELGDNYFIQVKKSGTNYTDVYPIEERERTYEVVMKEEFNELNGTYHSIKDIEDSIKSLIAKDLSGIEQINNRYVWKCDKCNTYGFKNKCQNFINDMPTDEYNNKYCKNCQKENKFSKSKWIGLEIYAERSIIGKSSGGSFAIISTYGNLKIIR